MSVAPSDSAFFLLSACCEDGFFMLGLGYTAFIIEKLRYPGSGRGHKAHTSGRRYERKEIREAKKGALKKKGQRV